MMAQHFPAIGDYFNNNDILLPGPGFDHGFFFNLVEASQEVGERPTAAFPSSHVGISTIVMIMAYRVNKKLCYFLAPFYVLLCCATVYIQAHYWWMLLPAGFRRYVFILWLLICISVGLLL